MALVLPWDGLTAWRKQELIVQLSVSVSFDLCDVDMTNSYESHDSFICVIWLIHVWHYSIICVTWLIHMWYMTHSYVLHDSFICVTWLIHMCDMTHSYVIHDSFICVTWLIHMCDMTHSYMWHDSFICVTRGGGLGSSTIFKKINEPYAPS